MINAVDDKIRDLDVREKETVHNISVEEIKRVTTKVEGLLKSQPIDSGKWIEKQNTV